MIALLQEIASTQGMNGVVDALRDRLQTQPGTSFEAVCEAFELVEPAPGYTGGHVSLQRLHEDLETGAHITLIVMKGCSTQPCFYPGPVNLFVVAGILHVIIERQYHTLVAARGAAQGLRVSARHLLQPWSEDYSAVVLESAQADRTFEAMEKGDLADALRLDGRDPNQLDPSWDTLELPAARALAFRVLEINGPTLSGSTGQRPSITLPPAWPGRKGS